MFVSYILLDENVTPETVEKILSDTIKKLNKLFKEPQNHISD